MDEDSTDCNEEENDESIDWKQWIWYILACMAGIAIYSLLKDFILLLVWG